jgi:hypothetical protein
MKCFELIGSEFCRSIELLARTKNIIINYTKRQRLLRLWYIYVSMNRDLVRPLTPWTPNIMPTQHSQWPGHVSYRDTARCTPGIATLVLVEKKTNVQNLLSPAKCDFDTGRGEGVKGDNGSHQE